MARALKEALHQMDTRRYRTGLEASGATPVHEIAAVFNGKRVWVVARPPSA